jgi:hypothetical protein
MTGMTFSLHHPLTPEQRTQLQEDFALLEDRLQNMAVVMHACYGDESQIAIRADEVDGALQRLRWELDRTQQKTQTATN